MKNYIVALYICLIFAIPAESSNITESIKRFGNETTIFMPAELPVKNLTTVNVTTSVPENKKASTDSRSSDDKKADMVWGYSDTIKTFSSDKWPTYYPICGGKKQSPILLQKDLTKSPEKDFKPLIISYNPKSNKLYGTLINNGHAYELVVDKSISTVNVTGGPLGENKYTLDQCHYHVSCDTRSYGSEHQVDGRKFVAELHLVFYNVKYGDMASAMEKPDGLTVWAFFIRSGKAPRGREDIFGKYIKDIINPGSSVKVKEGSRIDQFIKEIGGITKKTTYYYYDGSLTTPPCYETVKWIVFDTPLYRPEKEINNWRKLYGNEGKLCNNFRPLQTRSSR